MSSIWGGRVMPSVGLCVTIPQCQQEMLYLDFGVEKIYPLSLPRPPFLYLYLPPFCLIFQVEIKPVFQCIMLCVCTESLWSCPTLCNPKERGAWWATVHGTSWARILEWVAISSSRGSSQPRDWTWVSCIGRLILHRLSHQGRKCIRLLWIIWNILIKYID